MSCYLCMCLGLHAGLRTIQVRSLMLMATRLPMPLILPTFLWLSTIFVDCTSLAMAAILQPRLPHSSLVATATKWSRSRSYSTLILAPSQHLTTRIFLIPQFVELYSCTLHFCHRAQRLLGLGTYANCLKWVRFEPGHYAQLSK